MKKVILSIFVIIAVLTLAACNPENSNDGEYERNDVEVTHTVTTDGELNEGGSGWVGGNRTEVTQTFKTNPRYVAIFNYDILDMLDVVGIENTSILKLALPKGNIPEYLNKYNGDDYVAIGSIFIPDWTALDLFIPDLVIIGGRSAGSYDTFKEQYPNADILDVSLEYGEYLEGVSRNVINLAKIFPSIKTKLDTEFSTLKAGMDAVKEVAKNHEALFIMLNGEQLSFFPANGRFAAVHDEFGFGVSDPEYGQEGGSHGNLANHEYISSVNPEIILIIDRGSATGQGSANLQAFLNNALVKETNASKNNDIYSLNPTAWYISPGGFNSTKMMIADFNTFLENHK